MICLQYTFDSDVRVSLIMNKKASQRSWKQNKGKWGRLNIHVLPTPSTLKTPEISLQCSFVHEENSRKYHMGVFLKLIYSI